MLGPGKVRIVLEEISFKKAAAKLGKGYFHVAVDGTTRGRHPLDPSAGPLPLAQPKWSWEIDIRKKKEILVHLRTYRQVGSMRLTYMGTITHKLRPPFIPEEKTSENKYLSVDWRIESDEPVPFLIRGRGGTACREHLHSRGCTTYRVRKRHTRMELHPVRPVPRARRARPKRPRYPAGSGKPWFHSGGTRVKPGSPINVIPNPPVIPIVQSRLHGSLLTIGSADTCARIECTYYRPKSLKFKASDPRLVWKVVSLTGGKASFVYEPPRGLKAYVYGQKEGQVRLEVHYRGYKLAEYRALVAPLKIIKCRFNILNGPKGSQPLSGPAAIKNHVKVANRFLRQIGLELVFDTDASVKDGAVLVEPGIFRINVSRGTTRNVSNGYLDAGKLNYRPGILNVAYIHSTRRNRKGVRDLGRAIDIPASGIYTRTFARDTGSPSSSWIRPSGIDPDGVATTQSMKLLEGQQRASPANVCSLIITNLNGSPTSSWGMLTYGGTLAHEVGHVLNLRHRDRKRDSGHDGLKHPPRENLMHADESSNKAQDLDILQAIAARQSPLVKPKFGGP